MGEISDVTLFVFIIIQALLLGVNKKSLEYVSSSLSLYVRRVLLLRVYFCFQLDKITPTICNCRRYYDLFHGKLNHEVVSTRWLYICSYIL